MPSPFFDSPAPMIVRSCAIVTPNGPMLGFFELTLVGVESLADLFAPRDARLEFSVLDNEAAYSLISTDGHVDFYVKNAQPQDGREFSRFFAPALSVGDFVIDGSQEYVEGEVGVRLNLGGDDSEGPGTCFNWSNTGLSRETFERAIS